jgi:hypothetical protein
MPPLLAADDAPRELAPDGVEVPSVVDGFSVCGGEATSPFSLVAPKPSSRVGDRLRFSLLAVVGLVPVGPGRSGSWRRWRARGLKRPLRVL